MGGMQRHTRLLAEHMARLDGVRVTVLHPHEERVFDPSTGVHEVSVPGIDPARFYLREMWRYSGRMARAVATLKPDAVLAQGFCVWQGMDAMADRLLFHPHGLEMFQGLTLRDRLIGLPFRWVVGAVARRAACTVSLGGKLTPILARLGAKRVVVLPNAVEVPAEPAAYAGHDGPLRLLFVGRFAFNKGIDLLMDVARRLADEGAPVRFDLAGDGPLLAHYQAAGLPANVSLLGRVNDAELFALYTACDALVLPTRFEGMPTVVLEAMARARPIIVSDVGACAGLVENGVHGALLPPGDTEALHRAVERFIALDLEKRRAMGLAAYQRAHDMFDWPGVARAHVEVLRELARSAGQRV
jgi:glycosyltransferase involved in cell wall biosynthesis